MSNFPAKSQLTAQMFQFLSRVTWPLSQLSGSGSEEDMTRTALEDTLRDTLEDSTYLDGDPLRHTILSEDVLRSPQTMRALQKFRAGARKERYDGEQNSLLSGVQI